MTTENTNLEKAITGGLARPDWLTKGDVRGTEHITKDDAKMPRLGLAQKQHTDPDEPCYVKGVQVGDFFNDLTGVSYGPGPHYFSVVRGDETRYIEFNPRSAGGGVKDMDVKPGDPRTKWRNTPEGRLGPVATQFYDFVIVLRLGEKRDDDGNLIEKYKAVLPIMQSFKSTGIKHAKVLNGLIQGRFAPIFTGVYKLTSAPGKNAKGVFKTYKIENAGWIAQEEKDDLEALFKSFIGKKVEFNRDETENPEDEGDASFDHGANVDPAVARAAARASAESAGM